MFLSILSACFLIFSIYFLIFFTYFFMFSAYLRNMMGMWNNVPLYMGGRGTEKNYGPWSWDLEKFRVIHQGRGRDRQFWVVSSYSYLFPYIYRIFVIFSTYSSISPSYSFILSTYLRSRIHRPWDLQSFRSFRRRGSGFANSTFTYSFLFSIYLRSRIHGP